LVPEDSQFLNNSFADLEFVRVAEWCISGSAEETFENSAQPLRKTAVGSRGSSKKESPLPDTHTIHVTENQRTGAIGYRSFQMRQPSGVSE
jgi:hypothetical protein